MPTLSEHQTSITNTLRAIDWSLGYFTNEETKALTCVQNPIRLAQLVKNYNSVVYVRNCGANLVGEELRGLLLKPIKDAGAYLDALTLCLDIERAKERAKVNVIRHYSTQSNGQDDSWRVVIVLNKLGGELFPTEDACAHLWAALGMDPAASRCYEDYSPTGKMFHSSLSVRRCANGCVLLVQSGSRDV